MAEATSEEVLLEHHALLSSDIVALLQKPLIRVESSPDLGVVIQSLHARLEQLTHLHGRDVTDLKRLVDELSERLQENAAETEPAQEIVQVLLPKSTDGGLASSTATLELNMDVGGPRPGVGGVR